MPNIYFLGVHTAGSAAHRMFPAWLDAIGRQASLVGIDLMLDSPCASYLHFLESMRQDGQCLGAQITTHKVRLYDCVRDRIDDLESDARSLGEVGAIALSHGKATGFSPDMLALRGELAQMFERGGSGPNPREVLILGGGGAGRAIALSCAQLGRGSVSQITITELSAAIRADLQTRLTNLLADPNCPRLAIRDGVENDDALAAAAPGSLIVNATGRGKDSPGSPLSPAAVLPIHSTAWDLNYRGELEFLRLARMQALDRSAHVVDGWSYFLRNWFSCLVRLTGQTPSPTLFERFSRTSSGFRSEADVILGRGEGDTGMVMPRGQEGGADHRRQDHRFSRTEQLVLALLTLAAAGCVIVAAVAKPHDLSWREWTSNLALGLAGAVITALLTFLLIDHMLARQRDIQDAKKHDRERLNSLLARLRAGELDENRAIVEELRSLGWLRNGTLLGADLSGANLDGLDFTAADLQHAIFIGASLRRCSFRNAIISNSRFDQADLRGARFDGATAYGAEFSMTTKDADTVMPSPTQYGNRPKGQNL